MIDRVRGVEEIHNELRLRREDRAQQAQPQGQTTGQKGQAQREMPQAPPASSQGQNGRAVR
jgi:hypothetical protein